MEFARLLWLLNEGRTGCTDDADHVYDPRVDTCRGVGVGGGTF